MKTEQITTELSKLVISSDKQEQETQRKVIERLGEEAFLVALKHMKEQFQRHGIQLTQENYNSYWEGFWKAAHKHIENERGKENNDK